MISPVSSAAHDSFISQLDTAQFEQTWISNSVRIDHLESGASISCYQALEKYFIEMNSSSEQKLSFVDKRF